MAVIVDNEIFFNFFWKLLSTTSFFTITNILKTGNYQTNTLFYLLILY
jgi:hypothetical protein